MSELSPQMTLQKPKRKIWPWLLGCFGVFIFLGSFLLNVFLFFSLFSKTAALTKTTDPLLFSETIIEGRKEGNEKIAIINIEGSIFYQEDSWQSITGKKTGADFIVKQIRQAASDSKIKAIVLMIKSPGGSITASDEIYQETVNAKKAKKKVVAFLNETAASGGYYVALPADKIIASPTTITGSIGVISQTLNVEELLKKYGVKVETIKSGKYKDILSSFRQMTGEEQKIIQNIIDEYYQQFLNLIKENRKIDEEKLKEIADGRVFTASQAKELNLIDYLGYEQEAIDLAANLSNIKEKTVIRYKPPFSWESFFSQVSTSFSQNFTIKELLNLALFNQKKILFQ